jgi:hypothetical protein
MGPIQTKLEGALKTLGVDKQAYHSKAFVGNHIAKMLRIDEGKGINGPLVLTEAFSDHPQLRDRFVGVLILFSQIHGLIFTARFLTEDEIVRLTDMCHWLGIIHPNQFPERNITPKLHILVFHMPEFVARWKSLGLFSESGLESIHKGINTQMRTFCPIREKKKKVSLVFQNHSLKATADRSKLLPLVPMKCQYGNCGGRYKFDEKRKTRLCQQCGGKPLTGNQ